MTWLCGYGIPASGCHASNLNERTSRKKQKKMTFGLTSGSSTTHHARGQRSANVTYRESPRISLCDLRRDTNPTGNAFWGKVLGLSTGNRISPKRELHQLGYCAWLMSAHLRAIYLPPKPGLLCKREDAETVGFSSEYEQKRHCCVSLTA